jgi:hypothetical protein
VNTTATGVAFTMLFDTNVFDNASLHSTSSNTNRITVPSGGGGKYLFTTNLTWAVSTVGDYRVAAIRLNGGGNIAYEAKTPGGTNGFAAHSLSTFWGTMIATNYVDVLVQQNSGGNLDVSATGNQSPNFSAFWVGI